MTRNASIVHILLLFVFSSYQLTAQAPSADPSQDILPPSPNASSIAKYIDFPVNTSTGIPTISIPLGAVTGRGIAVPVSLNYHAGGVRIDDVSSSIGLGWSLSAGGVVTRSVQGFQDEDQEGFMFHSADVPPNPIATQQDFDNMQGFQGGTWDGQPDIFNFVLPGFSGKFVFQNSTTIRLIPQQDLKITYTTCSGSGCPNNAPDGSIISFTITTPDGIQYLFGTLNGAEVSKTQNYTIAGSTSCRAKEFIVPLITAWHLVSVTNPRTSDVISLNYSSNVTNIDAGYNESFSYPSAYGNTQNCTVGFSISKCITKKTDFGKILTAITGSTGKIEFTTSSTRSDISPISGPNRITEARVLGSENTLLKYFQFTQTFIQSSGTTPSTDPSSTYRMYLDAIKEFASDNTEINQWLFAYNNRALLPPRLSFKQDHWGYFNNKNNSQMTPAPEGGQSSLLYLQSYLPTFLPANREPDELYSVYGNISTVTYPTGGTTNYVFEGNQLPICSTVNVETPAFQSASVTYNGTTQTDVQYFTLDHDQYVYIGHNVQMNGFRCDGAYAWVKKTDPNNPFVNKTWGGCSQMANPVELIGYEPVFMKAGTYELKAVAQQGPLGAPYGSPFCCLPEQASVSVSYTNYTPTFFANKPYGGIRLKTSATADGISTNNIVRSYQYACASPGTCTNASSGVYMGKYPRYESMDYSIVPVIVTSPMGTGPIPCAYDLCKSQRLSSNSISQITGSDGAIVNYRETWTLEGPNGENGKRYFRHFIYPDGSSLSGPNYYNIFLSAPTLDYSYKNGNVVEEKVFNAQGQLIYQKLNDYELEEPTGTVNVRGFLARKAFEPYCPDVFIYFCDGVDNEGEEYVMPCSWVEIGTFPFVHYVWDCYFVSFPCYNQPAGTQITQNTALEPYALEWYDAISQFVYLKKTTERVFDSNSSGAYVETVTEHQYDLPQLRHHMPVKTISTNSDGVQYATKTVYPPEYTTTSVSDIPSNAIKNLKDNFIISEPIEIVQTIKKPSQSELVIGGKLTKYKNFGGNRVFPNESWQVATSSPISGFTFSNITGGNFAIDSRYYQTLQIGAYDAKGNLTEWNKKDDQVSSFIYGHGENRSTAFVRNAQSNEIAYTGFEEPGVSAAQNGYWVISGTAGGWNSSAGFVYTGKNGFNISTSRTITRSNLPAGTYIVSFYYHSGNIRANGSNVNSTFTSTWAYAEKTVTLTATGSISITAAQSGAYIDELRVCPADAQMRTFSLENNSLQAWSVADENSVPVHYGYDKSQRLSIILDQDRNIVQSYEYNYHAPGSALNNVKSRTVFVPGQTTTSQVNALTGASVRRVFQYLDGLGRPIQSNEIAQSPLQNDIIAYQAYDAFGRAPKGFLPYTISSNGGTYRTNAATEQAVFANTWGAGGYGYAETRFEASPLNRPLEQSAPGASWRIGLGHTTETLYRGNAAAESVRDFTNNTLFGSNILFVVETTDENERKTYTYTDKLGRTVMVKQQLATSPTSEDDHWSRTYTVYDDFGRVAAVIPPEAAKKMKTSGNWDWTSATYANMIYKYAYDNRGRVVSKSVPSGGVTLIWYDRLDRPVLTQDANGFKVYTRYDILSRPIVSGRYKGSALPGTAEPLYEVANTTAPHYYSTLSFPTDNNVDVYKVFYYDDYDLDNNNVIAVNEAYTDPAESGYETTAFGRIRGKASATRVGILKSDNTAPTIFLTTRIYYDKEYSQIQVNKQNHLGGTDITSSVYDFANRVTKTRRDHTATPPGGTLKTHTIREEYVYDHAGRVRFSRHKINSNNWVVTSAPVYDELNRLSDKRLHASNYDGTSAVSITSNFNYLQSVDYSYNIRGWLSSMNDPTICTAQAGDQLPDLFRMRLNYESTTDGGTAQYNGNISSMQWNTYIGSTCNTRQVYRFSYDAANRLTAADHLTWNGSSWIVPSPQRYSESNISYDLNGNLKTYIRQGLTTAPSTFGTIDNLSYFYDDASRPDRLTRISDAGNSTKGFRYTAAASSPHYVYDNNGNLTQDKHKNLNFAYNYLNLPMIVYDPADNQINVTYSADGEKLTKNVNGMPQNYVSGIEYAGANLEAIYHAEGRCTPNGATSFYYEYTLKDHLGNARVNWRANGTSVTFLEELHYYPFGMLMEGLGAAPVTANDYKYNSKELTSDLGLNWSDYGARWYDPAVGRWWSVDPLAEITPTLSGYVYGGNDPIKNIDIGGLIKIKYLDGKKTERFSRLESFLSGPGLRELLNEPDIRSGLKLIGGWTDDKIESELLAWGEGMIIEISDAPGGWPTANGVNKSPQPSIDGINEDFNTIQINTQLILQLEQASEEDKQAALLAVVSTLLHEAIHYGVNHAFRTRSQKENDGNFQKNGAALYYKNNFIGRTIDEPGVSFEGAIWGMGIWGTKWDIESFEKIKLKVKEFNSDDKNKGKIPQA